MENPCVILIRLLIRLWLDNVAIFLSRLDSGVFFSKLMFLFVIFVITWEKYPIVLQPIILLLTVVWLESVLDPGPNSIVPFPYFKNVLDFTLEPR